MRAKRKLNKFQKTLRKILIAVLSLIIAIIIFFELTVRERIELAIIAEIKTVSYTALNNAINDLLLNNREKIDNLINISVDNSYQIKSISENVYNVNTFKTQVVEDAQKYIDNAMKKDGIKVKLGNFTGLTILSDIGPYIFFNIESTPTVTCEILSSFESAGVNQTLHHIELKTYVDIYVGNPIRIESIEYTTKFEIAQTVIIGNIPSAYGSISRY
ncbi:MAG: sporulation protein YunB [Ruminococcus sp.]|nr:sporulation protein YunB [Ruminococcus sp.]